MVAVNNSLAHIATDPLRNFKFIAQVHHPRLKGFASLGFMSISGLNITTEVIPYREGGMNTTTQKMPGQTDFAPLTLSRGLAVGNDHMMQWMKELFSVVQGKGNGAPGRDFRVLVDIYVKAHPVTDRNLKRTPSKAGWRVYNAWPTSVAFSDLDAGANAIVIQQMTLAHEGFNFRLAKGHGAKANVDFTKGRGRD